MEPNNNSGRNRNVTGSASVEKRGDGLGSGPVGKNSSHPGGTPVRQSSGSKLIPIIAIIIVLLGGGGGGMAALLGGGSDDLDSAYTSSADPYSNPSSDTYGNNSGTDHGTSGNSNASGNSNTSIYSGNDLASLLGGFSGSYASANHVSTGWQDGLNNTSRLNETVASGTPSKRTKILGNGRDVITIMVYMCGTDLESKYGMATNDMLEMCSADLSDNINIIIYTGGCSQWKTSAISNKNNQIYKVTNGGLELLESNMGSKAMTDPDTLTEFIKYCSKNYPANRNDLILWDHGGGSLSGYGYDEKNKTAGSMGLSGINKALKNGGVTFDFVGFDACLMATLETGLMMSSYADYMIASEETEPGIGWYYTDWLNELSKDPSMPTTQIGKNIVDGFVNECARKCAGQKTTLSVIDLAELNYTVPDKLSSFSQATTTTIRSNNYKTISDARAGSREFAVSSKIDQIDLVNFANSIGSKEAKELSDALLSAVKYNRTSSSMTNAYGISIYFPYKKASKVSSAVSSYQAIGLDDEYSKCIQSFAGLEQSGQISAGGTASPLDSLMGMSGSSNTSGQDAIAQLLTAFMTGGRSIPGVDGADYMQDSDVYDVDAAAEYVASHQFDASKLTWTQEHDGSYTLSLASDQWELIQSLQENMFLDDGEGYIDLGLDNVYSFTDDGKLIGNQSNAWLAIDGQPIAYYYEDTYTDGDTYTIMGRSPVLLNGNRADLILVFDSEHPTGYIAGARLSYVDGETDTIAKGTTELKEGDSIDFLCDYYAYDGTYEDSYFLGDSITYHKDIEVSDVIVEGNSRITYLLTDLYNQEYWTPAVP